MISVIIDTGADNCATAAFTIGSSMTATTRNWEIKATQYACGDVNAGDCQTYEYIEEKELVRNAEISRS